MLALVLALTLAAKPDAGMTVTGGGSDQEEQVDAGWCHYTWRKTETRCNYDGSKEVMNTQSGKLRHTEFEGNLPCGKTAEVCGKKRTCECKEP